MSRVLDLLGTSATTFFVGLFGKRATFDASALTANRTITLPNKAGTLAMTSDIPSSITIAVARNIGTMRAY